MAFAHFVRLPAAEDIGARDAVQEDDKSNREENRDENIIDNIDYLRSKSAYGTGGAEE
jgi:hypothetical protein